MFHFGITVRTDTFFFRDITWNFYYGKGLVQIGTDGFLLSDPFMLFYNCRWLRFWDGFFYWLGSLCFFTGCSKELPLQFISVSFRFAMVLRRSFMVALRSVIVCSCSLFVFNRSWIISSASSGIAVSVLCFLTAIIRKYQPDGKLSEMLVLSI